MSCSFFYAFDVRHVAWYVFLERWVEGKEGGINKLVYVKAFCKL